jgi:hypothetical protein
MPEALFDVIFTGKLTGDTPVADAKRAIQSLFKLDDRHAERLMSGRRVVVKRAVPLDTARRFQAAFREVGALSELAPIEDTETIVAAPPPPDPDRDLRALSRANPPASAATMGERREHDRPPGDLRSSVDEPATSDIRISGLTLAEPGAPLDQIDDLPPPRHPETSHLSLIAGPDWTLEDCAPSIEPAVVPETGALDLEPIEAPRARPDQDALD